MIALFDRADFVGVISLNLEPRLRRRLLREVELLGQDLLDWTTIVVVEPGDSHNDVVGELGFDPLVDPTDGWTYGEARFVPTFDVVERVEGYLRAVFTFGSTAATILLVNDANGGPQPLRALLKEYADT